MKSINEQINTGLIARAKKLSHYKQLLNHILPPECQDHVDVGNIRQQSLILVTDSPVWTTRLRQLSPQILQYIHNNAQKSSIADSADLEKIHHVEISTRYRVSAQEHEKAVREKTAARPRVTISEKTARMLSQSAQSIDYQPLKTALLKLASHTTAETATSDSKDDKQK